jgi:hypothetical protein
MSGVRRRTRALTAFSAALVALAFQAGALPAVASAHLRSGTVAVDYQATLLRPSTAAYAARIFQSDRALSLTLRRGHTVTVLGYIGEPMLRLDGAGLSVNAASLTAVSEKLVKPSQRVVSATPRWLVRPGRTSVIWQDARVRGLPSGATRGIWRVPVIVDGRRAALTGSLHRFPAPALWPWLVIVACFLAVGAVVLVRRRDLLRTAAIAFAVLAAIASIVVALMFALDTYASPGTWIAGADELIFLAIGLYVLRRGPRHLHLAAAIGLGLLGLAIGISKGAVFLHPIVLAVSPADVTRFAVAVAIGAGITGGALGSALFAGSSSSSRAGAPDAVDGSAAPVA